MPSQLYNNSAIKFICAKNFLYNGHQYKLGDDFPQEEALNLETLVRTRAVIPVVDDWADKPRHWQREVRLKSEVMGKLKTNQGEHLLNSPKQIESDAPPDIEPGQLDPWDETEDNAAEIKRKAAQNIEEDESMGKQQVTYVNGKEESEPLEMIAPGEDTSEYKVEVKEVDEPEPEYPKGWEKRAEETNNGLADPGPIEIDKAAGEEEGFGASSGGWNLPTRSPVTAEEVASSESSYDPSDHTVSDVNAYLEKADEVERSQVLEKEKTGKARKGILEAE